MADDEKQDDSGNPSALEHIATIVQGAGEDAVGAAVGEAITGGDPKAVAGAALVGALRGAAKKGASAMARLLWDSPDQRLAAAVQHEAREHLELVAPIVEENAERLLDDPEVRREDLASSAAALLVGWERAYRATGDAKKRRVIMAALGNAFRPELFKEGLTLRLFRILEDLDYPEIRFLRNAFGEDGRLSAKLRGNERVLYQGTELREYMERLAALRLVLWAGSNIPGARRAWLGVRLLELCADTEALNRVWPDPEARPGS